MYRNLIFKKSQIRTNSLKIYSFLPLSSLILTKSDIPVLKFTQLTNDGLKVIQRLSYPTHRFATKWIMLDDIIFILWLFIII